MNNRRVVELWLSGWPARFVQVPSPVARRKSCLILRFAVQCRRTRRLNASVPSCSPFQRPFVPKVQSGYNQSSARTYAFHSHTKYESSVPFRNKVSLLLPCTSPKLVSCVARFPHGTRLPQMAVGVGASVRRCVGASVPMIIPVAATIAAVACPAKAWCLGGST